MKKLLQQDLKHVIHPYSSLTQPSPSILIESAKGAILTMRNEDGSSKELVDGMSSWVRGFVPVMYEWIVNAYVQEYECTYFYITLLILPQYQWAAIHGYRHPVLDAALHKQVDTMSHVMFGGITHEPAIKLVNKLVELTPAPLTKAFLCDSGSVSVEVAMKMAVQYQYSIGRPERSKFVSPRNGYVWLRCVNMYT